MIESNGGRATSNTTAPSVSANSLRESSNTIKVETYKPDQDGASIRQEIIDFIFRFSLGGLRNRSGVSSIE